METEIIETVLKEILEELKQVNIKTDEQGKSMQELKTNVESFNQKLANQKIIVPLQITRK